MEISEEKRMIQLCAEERVTPIDPDLLEELEHEIAHRKTFVGRLKTLREAWENLSRCVSVEVLKLLRRLGMR